MKLKDPTMMMGNDKLLDLTDLPSQDLDALLMLADFFTRFHAEFATDHENRENLNTDVHRKRKLGRVVISPQDVLSAIIYRRDVQQYHMFSSQLEYIKQSDHYTSSKYVQVMNKQFEEAKEQLANEIWKRKQNRIGKGRMSKDEDISTLLSTFEVWATKAIAEEKLIHKPTHGSASCSAVLSIPCGDYFAAILPKCKYSAKKMLHASLTMQDPNEFDKNYKGKLGVTPNSLTYKEFLRLSFMISSLDDNGAHSALSTSSMTKSVINPLRAYDPNHPTSIYSRKETAQQEHPHQKFRIRGVDLVALWIRAQRNTSALLLLMNLFQFHEDNFEDAKRKVNLMGKDKDDNQKSATSSSINDPNSALKTWKYTATYNGNLAKMQSLSNRFAVMVEDLVNFSVANQLLFTQEYMHSKLLDESKKEKSAEKLTTVTKTIQISPHLEPSAKQFILRWLARRHRRALHPVFAGDISYDHEYMSYLKSYDLNYESIKEETKRILWYNFKTVDRTLSRIDRKIPNPAMECCTTIASFKTSVGNILSALEQAVSISKPFTERVKAAKIDFELLCNKFLSTTGPCLSTLIRDQSGSDASDVLESLPEPWDAGVKCATCKQKVSGNSVVQCWNCGEQVHEDCIHSEQSFMYTENLEEDRQLFSVYLHAHDIPSPPDYVTNQVDWSEHVISLNRGIESNGQYSSWGLSIVYTEACERRYEECVRSVLDPTRWSKTFRDFGGNSPVLRAPHSGFLITKCQSGSKLKVGDIVTEISLCGDQLLPSFLGNQVLVHLRHEEIGELVKAPASEMTLKVFRPSKDITKASDDFIRDFKNIQEEVCELHQSILKNRWYCRDCDGMGFSSTTAQDDAIHCQAIIRRLGMEESSLPFHDEMIPSHFYEIDKKRNHSDDAISVSSCDSKDDLTERHVDLSHLISLRRLDAIMETLTKPIQMSDKNIILPPWMSNPNLFYSDRSLWNHPSRILCAGMVSIFERSKKEGIDKAFRKDLLAQFVRLYVAWCKDVKGRRSKGPPKVATVAVAPWLIVSCSSCRIRPVDFQCGELCITCFQLQEAQQYSKCLDPLNDFQPDLNSIQTCIDSIAAYDRNTGFVGSLLFVNQHDSLIQSVISRTGLVLEEGRTLCTLLAISYIPSKYITSDKVQKLVLEKSDEYVEEWQNASGLFFILPLLGTYQSNYLPEYCKFRADGQSPLDLPLLQLDGIIGMTPFQFQNRLNQTRKIIESVDRIIYSTGKIAGLKEVDSISSLCHNQVDSGSFNDILSMRERDDDDPFSPRIVPSCDSFQNTLSELRRSCAIMGPYCLSQEFSELLSKLNAISSSRQIVGRGDDDAFCASRGKAWEHHSDAHTNARKRRKLFRDTVDIDASSSYLQDMVVFDAVNVVQERKCQLYYTDFVFWDKNVYNHVWTKRRMDTMKEMNKIMAGQHLCAPSNLNDRIKLVVLQRTRRKFVSLNGDVGEDYHSEDNTVQEGDDTENYPGLGWGFELILWSDNMLRVGRVAKSSPAYCAGLQPNAKVLSVDGVPSFMIRTKTELANHLLGGHLKENILVEENIAQMPYLYQEQSGGRIKELLVLEVQNDTKNQVAFPLDSENEKSTANILKQPNQPVKHRLLISEGTKAPLNRPSDAEKILLHQQKPIHLTHSLQQPIRVLPHQVENILKIKDLYSPGVNACFFTMAECAVLIEAMKRNCPKLSIRLLTPRYDPFRVDEEYKIRLKPYIEKHGISCIPRLSEDQWQELLGWDLKRIRGESGPVIFTENNFEYRQATVVLPIDRLFDTYFRKLFHDRQQVFSNQYRQIHTPQIENINHNRLIQAHTQSTSQTDDQGLRIRGGGDEQKDHQDLSLSDLQVKSATNDANKYVFGWWKDDNVCIYVGRLVAQPSTQDTFSVKIMHVFPTGTLSEQKLVDCQKNCTFLLPDTDITSSLQHAVQAAKKAIGKYRKDFLEVVNLLIAENSQPVVSLDERCVVGNTKVRHSSRTNIGSKGLFHDNALKLMTAALKIEEDLAISATSFLGTLPNGDMVHWYGSDPTVLYIRKHSSESGYSAISKALTICDFDCNKDGAPVNGNECIGILGNTESLHIDTRGKGEKRTFSHFSSEHLNEKYTTNRNEPFEWIRVSDGNSIRNLCADLTAHLCAKCSQLNEFVVDFEPSADLSDSTAALKESVIFDVHTFVELSDRGMPSFSKLKNIKISMRTRELIVLWVKIACLFRVESNGLYRLEKSLRPSLQQLFVGEDHEYDDSGLMSMIGVEDDTHDSFDDPNENIPSSLELPCNCCDRDAIDRLNCQICRRPGEVVLSSDTDKHGAGCCLLSDLCFEYTDTTQRRMMLAAMIKTPKTTMQVLKNMLLKIAANTPLSLHHRPEDPGTRNVSIWGSKLSGWVKSVQMAHSVHMLSQALTVLKMSLDVSRMPRWWKTPNCGWVNNSTLILSCTKSSFALHLYILDAAITEAAATVPDNTKEGGGMDISDSYSDDEETIQAIKSDLKRLSHRSIKERFAVLQDWASDLKIHVFEGDYHDDCVLCGDGGDLICCEYCPNVAHQGCLGLRHTFSNNEAWVCDACKDHIIVARSHFKGNFLKLQQWAAKAKINIFEGDSLDDCIICHDGGDLLCCEYCPNVAHQDCLGLKHSLSNDEGWVCNQCRNHIIISRSKMD